MDLYQAIHARRSIRKFAATPIPEEILERMLGAMQDITEQRKNEQQIILEKELSDSIINSFLFISF